MALKDLVFSCFGFLNYQPRHVRQPFRGDRSSSFNTALENNLSRSGKAYGGPNVYDQVRNRVMTSPDAKMQHNVHD